MTTSTTTDTTDTTIRTAAERWAEEAVREAIRQGWRGDSSTGCVRVGVCGMRVGAGGIIHYHGLDEALAAVLGCEPTADEIESAQETALKIACDRLDDDEWRRAEGLPRSVDIPIDPVADWRELGEWADSRETSVEVAQAIHEAAARHTLSPQTIWEDGAEHIVQQEIAARAWELADEDEDELCWGETTMPRPAVVDRHTTDPITTYTTHGSVRRSCGHRHRSIDTAVDCLLRDQRACDRTGGYSDRRVVRTDGQSLSDADAEQASDLEIGVTYL